MLLKTEWHCRDRSNGEPRERRRRIEVDMLRSSVKKLRYGPLLIVFPTVLLVLGLSMHADYHFRVPIALLLVISAGVATLTTP